MLCIAALFVVVFAAGLSPATKAFHTLKCGPFRTTIIDIQQRNKQQQFTRGHTLDQREPVRDREQSRIIQEGLTHQD